MLQNNKGGSVYVCHTEKNATGVPDNPRTECFLEGCAPWATEGVRVSHHQMKRANTPTAPPYPPPLPPAGASQPPSTYTPHSQTSALPFISLCLPFPSGDEECLSVRPCTCLRWCSPSVQLYGANLQHSDIREEFAFRTDGASDFTCVEIRRQALRSDLSLHFGPRPN